MVCESAEDCCRNFESNMITGGGFVLGGLANESTLCMSMCDGAGVAVVDVNYRHCPGSFNHPPHEFPLPHMLTRTMYRDCLGKMLSRRIRRPEVDSR